MKQEVLRFFIKALLETLFIFLPLIVATLVVLGCEVGAPIFKLKSFFHNVPGNSYVINDVLLTYILAAHLTIFIGLVLYFFGAVDDLSYSGDNALVKWLNIGNIVLLVVVVGLLIFFLLALVIAMAVKDIGSLSNWLGFNQIVSANSWVSIIIFTIFMVADIINLITNSIQKNGCARVDQQKLEQYVRNIRLARDATLFVNIPTLLLTGGAFWLTSKLYDCGFYKTMIDAQLEVEVPLKDDLYQLFFYGTEVGVLTSGIFFLNLYLPFFERDSSGITFKKNSHVCAMST